MVSDHGLIYKMSKSGELLITKIKTFYYFHLDYKTACFFLIVLLLYSRRVRVWASCGKLCKRVGINLTGTCLLRVHKIEKLYFNYSFLSRSLLSSL